MLKKIRTQFSNTHTEEGCCSQSLWTYPTPKHLNFDSKRLWLCMCFTYWSCRCDGDWCSHFTDVVYSRCQRTGRHHRCSGILSV